MSFSPFQRWEPRQSYRCRNPLFLVRCSGSVELTWLHACSSNCLCLVLFFRLDLNEIWPCNCSAKHCTIHEPEPRNRSHRNNYFGCFGPDLAVNHLGMFPFRLGNIGRCYSPFCVYFSCPRCLQFYFLRDIHRRIFLLRLGPTLIQSDNIHYF